MRKVWTVATIIQFWIIAVLALILIFRGSTEIEKEPEKNEEGPQRLYQLTYTAEDLAKEEEIIGKKLREAEEEERQALKAWFEISRKYAKSLLAEKDRSKSYHYMVFIAALWPITLEAEEQRNHIPDHVLSAHRRLWAAREAKYYLQLQSKRIMFTYARHVETQ
jgi:hypothetical protein